MVEEIKKEEKKSSEKINIQAIATPDKIIPKLCTHVNFGITTDKHVLIAFTFQDEKQNILIDRVVTTFEHAKNISKVLNGLIERVEKDGTTIQKTK